MRPRRTYKINELNQMIELYRTHTAPEISQIMNIPESSVISLLHRNGVRKTSEELGAVIRRTRPSYKRKCNKLVKSLRLASEHIRDGDHEKALSTIQAALTVEEIK